MSYFFVSFLSVLALENCGLSNDLLLYFLKVLPLLEMGYVLNDIEKCEQICARIDIFF